jgi:hypothetical protein
VAKVGANQQSKQEDFSTWVTKAQAVAQTNLGERTIERLMANGTLKFAHRRVPGRKPLSVIDPASLEKLQQETLAATPHVPTVVRPPVMVRPSSKALVPARPVLRQSSEPTISYLVPLTEKFFLTLPEAVQLSGLPASYLKRLIAEGTLKAIRAGGWRIRRADLALL